MSMINELRRMHRTEAGVVLPLVLVFLALGMLLITPTLGLGSTSLEGTMVNETKALELYAADAGVEDAMHWLLNEDRSDGKYVESQGVWNRTGALKLNGADVAVSYEDRGENILITSVATIGSSKTKVEALVASEKSQGGGNVFTNGITALAGDVTIGRSASISSDPPSAKAGNIYAAGKLVLGNSAKIAGDIYAGSGVELELSSRVDGNVHTPGAITQSSSSSITGDIVPNAPEQNPQRLSTEELDELVASIRTEANKANVPADTITRNGSWTPSDPEYLIPEHVKGDLIVNASDTVLFLGSVHVNGNLVINSSAKVTFMAPVVVSGNLVVGPSASITCNSSLWTGGDLSLGSSSKGVFQGLVRVGGTLDLTHSGKSTFGSTIYVLGDLKTGSSAGFAAGHTIAVMGDTVALGPSSSLNNPETLPLIVCPTCKNLSIGGSGSLSAAVYAPEAHADLSNGSLKIYGAITCRSASVGPSVKVTYPVGLGDRTDLPGTKPGSDRPESLRIIAYEILPVS